MRGYLIVIVTISWLLPAGNITKHCVAFEKKVRDEKPWRVPNHDGVNVAYVYARIHHSNQIDYKGISKQLVKPSGTSFVDLRDVLQQNGVSAEILKTDIEGLMDLRFPVLVYLDRDRESAGEFVLLLKREENYWFIFNGTYAIMSKMSPETFRRRWSGYVLAIPPDSLIKSGTYLAVMTVIILYCSYRYVCRRRSMRNISDEQR